MDINRAKEIIKLLAEGIDPVTGEVLPFDNVCNQGEIVRAFYTVINYLEQEDRNVKKKTHENQGKRWEEKEDILLCEMFNSGKSIKELSDCFKRSKGSISARLVHLGLIENRQDVYPNNKKEI